MIDEYENTLIGEVFNMEDAVVSQLGYEWAFNAVTQAVGAEGMHSIYEYIIRCYDIDCNGF